MQLLKLKKELLSVQYVRAPVTQLLFLTCRLKQVFIIC